ARLCSQQEVMKARLCAAQARQQMEGGLGKSSRRRPAIILAAVLAGGLIVAVGAMMLLPWGPGSPQVDSTPITAPVIAPTKPPLGPAKPAGANLWDFSEGTVVTNWSKTKSDIRNMFGGTFGNSVMLFSDGLPVGTVHFVEWQTPTPITLRSFSLRACHDGRAAGALLRGFSCFRLFAEDPDTGKFDIKLYEISPTNPYGDMPEPPYTHLDRSRGFQHMVLAANIPATTARRFRAEFVQFGPANRAFSGPRIIELEGFDTYYPDQAIPENHKPAPPVAAPSVASKPAPAAAQPPKPNLEVPPDAALLMTFDKNTILDVSGIIFRIRSLTGRCNGKDITAQFTPDGKVGGAISIVDGSEVRIPGHIVNRQPEYTVTAWIKRKDNEHLWVYNENADGTIYNFEAQTNGSVAVRAWHKGRGPSPSYPGGNWMDAGTPEGLVPANQWVFVAARLVNGQVDRGQLTIRVNDRSYACEQQMVYHDSTQYASIGSGNGAKEDRTSGRGAGLVDELTVYPRALSDAEIETFYQMGLRGESLGM
ncbi:MAG: LamG domain-containing protein, partial [Pirellulales bacterium]|nr:LamG domain-containing protein [Pirellulales bacterium]